MSQSDSAAPQSVVFIASNVPDLQDLLGGLAPGVQAFVINPSQDGLDQIADILATNNLSNLASISIVAHGASGELELGSSPIIGSDLASNSNALAEIGASLATGGIIQLYGCDVAEGAGGQQFIDNFSTLAGGATVEAATHLVGSAADGGSWALDAFSDTDTSASTGSAGSVADGSTSISGSNVPFTPTALANFQGELTATVQTELWITAGVLGTDETELLHVDDSGSGNSINNTTLWTVTSSNAPPSVSSLLGVALDPVDNVYFLIEGQEGNGTGLGGSNNPNVIWKGTLSSELSSPGATPTLTSIYSQGGGLATTGQITGIALNAAAQEVYFGQGHGIYEVGYNGGSVTTLATTGNADIVVKGLTLDLTATPHPEAFFFSHTTTFTSTAGGKPITTVNSNAIYVDSNLGQANVTPTSLPMSPADGSLGGNNFPVSLGVIEGIAVDPKTQKLYFTTTPSTNQTTEIRGSGGIYEYNLTSNGTGTYSAVWVEPPSSTLDFSSIEIDDSTGSYYVTDANESSGTGIYKGSLTSSAQPTLFATITSPVTINGSNSVYVEPEGFDLDNAPTLSGIAGITTDAVQGGAAVELLTSTPSASDPDSSELAGATIQITNGKTGDELFVDGVQSGTLDSGRVTVSWNATSFALTLSGADVSGDYAGLLSEVSYQDTGSDTTTAGHPTRTVAWSVTDGLLSSTVTDTTVTIDRPPTQATHSTTVLKGGTVGPTSAGDADPDGDSLTVTSVTGGTVGSAEAGTYGTVTISANDTYSYSANSTTAIDDAASGSHPVDSFTYTVSDPYGGSTLETLNISIDRPPTAVADSYGVVEGGTVTGTNGSAGNGTGVLENDGDLDGDPISVTAVDGSAAGVGASVAGSYGHLTLVASGGFTYVADQTTAIDDASSGAHPVDVFSYTISDGDGGSATATVSFTIDRPPVASAYASELGEGATVTGTGGTSGTGVLGNDSDPDGDPISVTAVNSSAADVGAIVSGTYGELTLNVSGGFTYVADQTTAIDNAATGAHPVDTFTYTISDGDGGSSTADISFTIDRPAAVTVNATPTFSQGGTAVVLDSTLTVSAPDTNSLTSATVAITGGTFAGDGDVLSAGVSITSITASYDSADETLMLSGSASVADYDSVLDSVTFDTSSTNPSDFGAATSRTITWTVYDGEAHSSSASATETLNLSLTTLYVTPGTTSSGLTISNGITLDVLSGGTASNTTVSSGGHLEIESGGYADPTTIASGGSETVKSGGSDNGALISSGGTQDVFGLSLDPTVNGVLFVESGGSATGANVSSGGVAVIYGSASGTTVFGSGREYIESGGIASGETITGTLYVEVGASAVSATIVDYGAAGAVYGVASDTTLFAYGRQYVLAGGTAVGAQISAAGTEFVESGGTDQSGTISYGGLELIYGAADATTEQPFGEQEVESGGLASGVLISGGTQYVLSGGTASGGTAAGTSTMELGTLSGTVIVASGGSVVGLTLSSGGIAVVTGAASATTVASGGREYVSSGGVASGGTDAGTVIVEPNGRAVGLTIGNGGGAGIYGSASGTTIASGGRAYVESGGTASGGSDAGLAIVEANGSAVGLLIGSGGLVEIYGTASGTTVAGHGQEYVESGGTESGTLVDSGGRLEVFGTLRGGTVSGLVEIGSGGSGSGVTIGKGGSDYVLSGGADSNALVSSGGLLVLYGSATSASIGRGGTEYVESGGIAGATTVGSGGEEYMLSGGEVTGLSLVSGTMIMAGGTVSSGAIVETASSGSVLVGTITNSGTLFAAGSASTIKVIGAITGSGTAEVGNGVIDLHVPSGENVVFQSGGSGGLQLDDALGSAYTGQVSGFGAGGDTTQFIDLTQIVSGATTSLSYTPAVGDSSGTLTVTDGGIASATIAMIGNYSSSSFKLGADSNGDVKITDPPVAAQPVSGAFSGDGGEGANLALLGQYMASPLATASFGGGTPIAGTPISGSTAIIAHGHG